MKLQNVMEDIVIWAFEKHSHALNLACTCKKCTLDVKAITLNSLPSYYIVNETNQAYIRAKYIESQYEVDLLSELANAAKLVSQSPKH